MSGQVVSAADSADRRCRSHSGVRGADADACVRLRHEAAGAAAAPDGRRLSWAPAHVFPLLAPGLLTRVLLSVFVSPRISFVLSKPLSTRDLNGLNVRSVSRTHSEIRCSRRTAGNLAISFISSMDGPRCHDAEWTKSVPPELTYMWISCLFSKMLSERQRARAQGRGRGRSRPPAEPRAGRGAPSQGPEIRT